MIGPISITEKPIQADDLLAQVSADEFGAVILFLGTVRNEHQGRKVISIDYDVHPELARQALSDIAGEIEQSHPVGRVVITHRVGHVKTGEIAIGIAVSGAHRDEAYRASRQAIEEIKRRVPIWKKENYEDGESAWLKGTVLDRGAAES
ncbi:MAG: hypothetical protein A2X94_07280 [Bdellovibrionales bacterium GWB1_55_8]|nr:MAG: hypothetical protein A2X94_07280 [Bdellovibrionales bacterium GWB1_55_8]